MKIVSAIGTVVVMFAACLLSAQPAHALSYWSKTRCDKIVSHSEAPIPKLAKWRVMEQVRFSTNRYKNKFTYTFYHDTSRPQLRVAAMVISRFHPAYGVLRRTVVKNGKRMYVYMSSESSVCVHINVENKNGTGLALEKIMDQILKIAGVVND